MFDHNRLNKENIPPATHYNQKRMNELNMNLKEKGKNNVRPQ